jgi:hypothetical protein
MLKPVKYFLLSIVFWVAVDYTTVFNPDFGRWMAHMPLIWVFYLGCPLIFSWLIYKRNWQGRKLFIAVLVCMVACELILFNNSLLYTFPIMLIMIPIAICIYSFITYLPMWITDGSLRNHKGWTIFLTMIWLIVALLNYANNTSA